MNTDEDLSRMIDRTVKSFEEWLKSHIRDENNSRYFTGYQMRVEEDKYEVVFAFQKNGEDGWWNKLGEYNESGIDW